MPKQPLLRIPNVFFLPTCIGSNHPASRLAGQSWRRILGYGTRFASHWRILLRSPGLACVVDAASNICVNCFCHTTPHPGIDMRLPMRRGVMPHSACTYTQPICKQSSVAWPR
eukprot:355925-Chlamydomonas_euryale.AAC.2